MKIKNYKLEATIPTTQFGNLRPTLEMDGNDLKEMTEVGLDLVKDLHSRFSDTPLKEQLRQVSETVKLSSFNEKDKGNGIKEIVEVEFDPSPTAHTYLYKKDKFESGSVYASKFYKKFDGKSIAKNCEGSWGVKAKDIESLWSSNAKIATDFGTIVHQTLEHYFNYKSTAQTILKNKEDDIDRAMPKHPLLKSIIEEFMAIDKFEGEVLTEVFITDIKNKRCGQIDRLLILDKEKKVCRVQDYKVNVSAEEESPNMKALAPYDELPPNKLTKYQIQLSFYANILKESGWTVEGLDVYVLEDGWKHYELDILDIK